MSDKKTINVYAGNVLRLKTLGAFVDGQKGLAQLRAPAGRQLVALVLGVSDPGVEFHVEPMLGALGYVPASAHYTQVMADCWSRDFDYADYATAAKRAGKHVVSEASYKAFCEAMEIDVKDNIVEAEKAPGDPTKEGMML